MINPILSGNVTLARYRLEPAKPLTKDRLQEALRLRAFAHVNRDGPDARSNGAVELEDPDAAEFGTGELFFADRILFGWRIEELKVPPAAVREEMRRWRAVFERENQRSPGSRERAEARAGIEQSLRQRVIPATKLIGVAWRPDEVAATMGAGTLDVWGASPRLAEEVSAACCVMFSATAVPVCMQNIAEALEIPDAELVPTASLSMPATHEASSDEATEAEADSSREAFLRGKAYLGREFLTWLLWLTEAGDTLLQAAGKPVTALFVKKLVLRGISGDVAESRLAGQVSPYSTLTRRALARGLLIAEARLLLQHNGFVYDIGIDAELLGIKGAVLPDLLTREADDRLVERIEHVERIAAIVRLLAERWLRLRVSRAWAGAAAELGEWIRDVSDGETPDGIADAVARFHKGVAEMGATVTITAGGRSVRPVPPAGDAA